MGPGGPPTWHPPLLWAPLWGVMKVQQILDSRRLRLDGGSWSPYMLQSYAEAMGIHQVGIKRFEQIHDEMKAKKQAARAVGPADSPSE